jgi:hypothetical protein
MAFVYELISEADIDRFDLYKTEKHYGLSKSPLRWSFDRESDAYLRRVGSDREVPDRERFEFHYRDKTELLVLDVKVESHPQHVKFTWSREHWLRSAHDATYLRTLRAALTAYEHGRWQSAPRTYEIAFDF